MKRWLWLGIKVGGVMSVLSWFGNLRRYNPHGGVGISAFPDLLTLLALPVLVFLVMRSVVRDGTASTRKSVRRTAMMAVLVSAVLYAVSDVLLGVVAFSRFFSQPVYGYRLLFFGFYMSLIGFVGLGWLTTWIASRWVSPSAEAVAD